MTYVAPDNGVLTLVAQDVEWVVVLDRPEFYWDAVAVSETFHGRDIFSPVAAHLAAGVPWDRLGSAISEWESISFPEIDIRSARWWAGEVLYLDHFGNAITNIGLLTWADRALHLDPLWAADRSSRTLPLPGSLSVGGQSLPVRRTYGEVQPGRPLGLVGNNGLLEVAVRDGSAGRQLGLKPGDPVVLSSERDE
jgi:S-adenosylmethionine hydrolase